MTDRHDRRLPRRALMGGAGILFASPFAPLVARAEGRDPRLLVMILRGGLDGLGTVAPVGDPAWTALRGEQAARGDAGQAWLRLDDFFALNPSMPQLHRLFTLRQAAIVHATATPYRERSHFDGQDVLESGHDRPGYRDSGWLNRAFAVLQQGGGKQGLRSHAFAVGPVAPLVVRGAAPIAAWAPSQLVAASEDTASRLLDLYNHTDPALAGGLAIRGELASVAPSGGAPRPASQGAAERAYFVAAAGAAARALAAADGPRVGALALNGWDTHVNEGAVGGQLGNRLAALDAAIAEIEAQAGAAWREMVVAIATEFGRTARLNGDAGTDHGTATVALLAGGALGGRLGGPLGGAGGGGRVIADWPGVADGQLHQARDLRPTTDLRSVLKGLLRDHLRVPEAALAGSIFPGSRDVAPMGGLVG